MKALILILALAQAASLSADVVYLFAHGLYNNHTLADYYAKPYPETMIQNDGKNVSVAYKSGYRHTWLLHDLPDMQFWIIQKPYYSFNFPDANRGFDSNQTSLGQDNEIKTLANEYGKIKNNSIVLMGMSRGASTILNFLGTRNPTSIVAAVIESPFDSILNTLDTHCGTFWLGFLPVVLYTSPNVLFGKFDRNGIFPIKVVDKIDKDLPILIVASLQDTFIPAINTATIYYKLLEHGNPHVYFVLLNTGTHGYLLEDTDGPIYLNVVHAFYKKYNLPHDATCAAAGDAILAQCQPSKKIVDEALKNKKSFIK